jgi:hypothetical protein
VNLTQKRIASDEVPDRLVTPKQVKMKKIVVLDKNLDCGGIELKIN